MCVCTYVSYGTLPVYQILAGLFVFFLECRTNFNIKVNGDQFWWCKPLKATVLASALAGLFLFPPYQTLFAHVPGLWGQRTYRAFSNYWQARQKLCSTKETGPLVFWGRTTAQWVWFDPPLHMHRCQSKAGIISSLSIQIEQLPPPTGFLLSVSLSLSLYHPCLGAQTTAADKFTLPCTAALCVASTLWLSLNESEYKLKFHFCRASLCRGTYQCT